MHPLAYLALLAMLPANDATGNLRPGEVLVIANRASPDSLAVARHYMEKRAIPAAQLFLLDYPEYRKTDALDDNPAWLSHADFRERMALPLRRFLEEGKLREQILCLVTTIDTPYRVGGFELNPDELADPTAAKLADPPEKRPNKQDMEFRKANASFDNELAWLYRPEADREGLGVLERKRAYLGQSPNPYLGSATDFRTFRKQQLADPKAGLLYMVARLDGPTAEIASALVDKAMQAESVGVQGKAYFDASGTGEDRSGMGQGDWWICRAAEETRKAGLETVLDTKPKLFGPGECPDALLYWGWYKVFDYTDAFNGRFPVGAIACHIASFEAANLRWKKSEKDPVARTAHGVPACCMRA